ncbi:DUF2809 domain-containing protein [Paenibacillus sp. NPDC058071]|uniref:ribosomal maturation YjgA family protein n=1 Tax=Paenibacillus sp. NPDC058071 TaxID=3346326 RepID=UPI0036DC501F
MPARPIIERIGYLAALLAAIILGLSSRIFSDRLPAFVVHHFGDALWAAMIYFGFRFLQPRGRLGAAALSAVAFSFAIEFSQLYQADWINHLRSTLIGGLILGKGFVSVDLVRYAAGIAAAYLLDRLFPHVIRRPAFGNRTEQLKRL